MTELIQAVASNPIATIILAVCACFVLGAAGSVLVNVVKAVRE